MEVKSEVGCCSGSLSSWPLDEVKVAGESYPTTLGGPLPIQRKRYLSINNMEQIAMKVFTKLISLYHKMPQRLLGIRWESVIRHMQIYIKKHCYAIVNIFMQRKLNAWFFICTIFECRTLVIVPLFLFSFLFYWGVLIFQFTHRISYFCWRWSKKVK